jgi:cellulose synthase/poly-beta-1,6-N-acetylglucosamine synthase-like glycosyltransferase
LNRERLTTTILIATYRRPQDLERCLLALERQTLTPDQVFVIVRDEDTDTQAFLTDSKFTLPLQVLRIQVPGLIAARNLGLDALCTDLVSMIDDDAAPHPDWLERIEHHFSADPRLGALGGRDRLVSKTDCDTVRANIVGKIRYFGNLVGNHHAGFGEPREVDTLIGVNMSFRRQAIAGLRVDLRLRGKGAQPNEDIAFCLAVRRRGWKLLYDPLVAVDHFEAPRDEPRHYAAMIPVTDPVSFGDVTYNWVVAIYEEFSPLRHFVYILWQFLVGTRLRPGLVQALRFTRSLRGESWRRFWFTQKAMLRAYVDLRTKAGATPGQAPLTATR